MRKVEKKKLQTIRRRIFSWYKKSHRPFLWRRTANPYVILVSEIMLQQTQSARVEILLPGFLRRFPDLSSLAGASSAEVIRAWKGMGYNNRAIRLRKLAIGIVKSYDGKIPDQIQYLRELPGIGEYTAHAIACFAFRQQVPVVDVNIKRVLLRLLFRQPTHDVIRPVRDVWRLAEQVLPRDAYTWNQALMELGSIYCKARTTACSRCPLKSSCASRHLGTQQYNRKMQARKRKEIQYDNIPRRIWRGKIIDALRNVEGKKAVPISQLGKCIKGNFSKTELKWLNSLVQQLEQDELVTVSRGKVQSVRLAG